MPVAAGGAAQASLRDEVEDADAIEAAAAQWLVLPADREDASLDSADKRAAARRVHVYLPSNRYSLGIP